MNKTTHYLRLALMAIVAAVATASCTDDDTQQAYDLNGYWQGSIEGHYYSDRYGGYDSWDTEIWFVQDGDFASGGYGREIDYNRRTGHAYDVEFDWEVQGGRILLDYHDGYRVIIRDYELYHVGSGQRFRGYFDDYDTGRTLAAFDLVKIGGWSDRATRAISNTTATKTTAPADSDAAGKPRQP